MKSLFTLLFTFSVIGASAQMSKNLVPSVKAFSEGSTEKTDWGRNHQRAMNMPIKSESLNDIKKVATLRNDTLFIHKRIDAFASIINQRPSTVLSKVLYNNREYVFKAVVMDEADFFAGNKGTQIR